MDHRNSSSSFTNQEPQAIHMVAKKTGKGARLMSQTKYVIEKIKHFLKKKRKGSTFKREGIVECTAEATGVSVRSVHDIYNEYISEEGKLLTPVKQYTISRVCVNPDSFNREVIQCTVHSFYNIPL